MLVTLSVVNTASVFVYKRQITFAKDDLTLKEFLISKNVTVDTIVEVKAGNGMNSLCSIELSSIDDIHIGELGSLYKPCFLHVVVGSTEPSMETESESIEKPNESQPAKKQKTLMDFARTQTSWPCFKNVQQVGSLKDYIALFNTNKMEAAEYLNRFISDSKVNAKILLHDALIILLKTKISGVSPHDVSSFSDLLQRAVDLYWYISPNTEKFKSHGAAIPSFFNSLEKFNDPTRSKHKVKNIRQETLLDLTAKMNTVLEKSFVNRKSFNYVRDLLEKLGEAAVKYSDYLEDNRDFVERYQNNDGEEREQKVTELSFLSTNVQIAYSANREANIINHIKEKLEIADFFEPVPLELDTLHRGHRYTFIKHLREKGLPFPNTILFSCAYGPAVSGNIYHVWKEDTSAERQTLRLSTINSIIKLLPRYFSRSHKKRARKAIELIMEDKISPAQYRAIYSELTGDESVADNHLSKEVDERMKLVLHTSDASVIRDLRVNNHRKSSFDIFWKLTEEKIEEMTAVNDRRHSETTQSGDVIVNLALACSVRDLYQQCKANAIEKGVTEENIPSLSWFRFQFWPKSSYLATALNYTGRFNVRFMVQQRNIRKFSVDARYCNALFKYSKELAIRFSNYCSFISTDDKCKIKVGEPNFPVAAVARGKRVLVAKNQVFQVADHDLSSVTLIPTVGLIHEIPDEVDKSWYRGTPYVYLKITATDPSSALRNAAEIEDMLTHRYQGKENIPPIIVIYTDGGPEHRSNFLSVKIALIALQKSLDADMLVAVRTAPGHSYRNPVEKVNCILNIGLYGIGVMRQPVVDDPFFEKKLNATGNTEEVRKLLQQKSTYTELFKKSLDPCISLITESFSHLSLKENELVNRKCLQGSTVTDLLKNIDLDENLTGQEKAADLRNNPKLSDYLKHCARERHYFFSVKKCGNSDCTTCKPLRLPADVFQQVHHLPDPVPDPLNEGHYKKFVDCYGTETSEKHMPSLTISSRKGHGIPFNPVLQHVKNTGLTLTCYQCERPRVIYSKKKVLPSIIKKFKRETNDLLFTCGTTIEEIVHKPEDYDFYVRGNLTCQVPVESLYYSANYEECCAHCGTTRKLRKSKEAYPICATCISVHERKAVARKKAPVTKNSKK